MNDRFLDLTPWKWLEHYPRYLDAILYRLDKLRHGGAPAESEEIVSENQEKCDRARQHHQQQGQVFDEDLDTFCWMLEELRVSMFAQPLGTAFSISAKRMDKQWEKVRGSVGL